MDYILYGIKVERSGYKILTRMGDWFHKSVGLKMEMNVSVVI